MKKVFFISILVIIALVASGLLYYVYFLPKEEKILVSSGMDDGTVYILREYGPIAGYIWGGGEGALIGTALSGNHSTISRGLMRFNISEWKSGVILLKIFCTGKRGDPGQIEIYVINDFGSLPPEPRGDPENPEDPGDVSSIWNLCDNGYKVATVTPEEGKWIEINVPEDVVTSYKNGDILAFMIKLSNEDIEDNNWFAIATYEYAISNNMDPPHLIIRK